MRRFSILLCFLLFITACTPQGSAPDQTPVSVPSPPTAERPTPKVEPVAEASPPPQKPLGPVDLVLTESDLDGDGPAEQVQVTEYGMIRILSADWAELFTYQLPAESYEGVHAEVYPLPDRPPLLRIYWDWCPYGYPDNLFVWHDSASGKLTTDRDPAVEMGRCGSYTSLGADRFEAMFRNNELYYTRTETWTESGLVMESSKAELVRIEADRLPAVLEMLTTQEIANPEALFATPDLYDQFRAQAKPGMQFEQRPGSEPGTMVLGPLKLTYETEPEGKAWIRITHLEWQQ